MTDEDLNEKEEMKVMVKRKHKEVIQRHYVAGVVEKWMGDSILREIGTNMEDSWSNNLVRKFTFSSFNSFL